MCGGWGGARGLPINLIDWAASGNGRGIVILLDGEVLPHWWTNSVSFLHDELNGHISYFRDNHPVISDAAATDPLNGGLSSAGLSNWTNSFHAGFTGGDVEGYTGTVFSTTAAHRGTPLVIVTRAFASAPVANEPLPKAYVQMLAALAAIGWLACAHQRRVGV